MNENIKLAAAILERCPSCMTNLARHICELTCSPDQSKFSRAAATKANDKGTTFYFLLCQLPILTLFQVNFM